jgi:hypothetical protein
MAELPLRGDGHAPPCLGSALERSRAGPGKTGMTASVYLITHRIRVINPGQWYQIYPRGAVMAVNFRHYQRMGAIHDPERRGILIPASQLAGSIFKEGDHFSVRKGQRDFFCVILQKDPEGDIVFEKYGIFIPRSRRVDAYMGGIFHEFRVDVDPDKPDRMKITPVANEYQNMCK